MSDTEAALEYFDESFVGIVAATLRLGHSTPVDTLVYLRSARPNFAVDFTTWCAHGSGWEEARDRIVERYEAARLEGVFGAVVSERLAALISGESSESTHLFTLGS